MPFSSQRVESKSKRSPTRLISTLGLIAAFVIAVAIPAVYFAIKIKGEQYTLTTEASFLAKYTEKIIQSRPDLWEYEIMRLKELISQPSVHGKEGEREIRTEAGKLVVITDFKEPRPAISVSKTFFDSGRVAGSIIMKHSIRTLIITTALLGILSSFLAYLIYFFQTYSIRKLHSTFNLLESEKDKFRAFYDLELVGLTITSKEKGWVDVNKHLCNMLEYTEDELHQMTWGQLTHPDDLAADVEQFERILSGEIDGYEMEKRFLSKNGRIIFTKLVVRCVRKKDGSFDKLVAMVEDITKRKQAEAALLVNEERLRTVVEASLDAIIAVNVEGQIVLFNGAAHELFQYSEEEALNQSVEILLREEIGKIHQERLEKFLKRGVGQCGHIGRRIEKFFRRKDGSMFEGQASMSGGRCDGLRLVVLVIHDITERKRAEEKIKASLLEKETMLQEIHHRVKNNLQVVSSLLNLQAIYLQDEKGKEALWESAERLGTMASIHAQLYESQDMTRVDFSSFIRKLIGNISQSYVRTGSPVEINVGIGEISLGIDNSIPCGLILNELISNALKHAFPEGKEGEINVRMRLEYNQMVLTVQDNGIGFPESMDLTNLKSLGLNLVNILVRQMNGKTDMRVDGGTTWTITFPVKKR